MIEATWTMLILSLLGGGAGYLHLVRLPVAPACPHCHGVTDAAGRASVLDRVFGALANAVARECRRCGWAGRMRWRLAPRRTRVE